MPTNKEIQLLSKWIEGPFRLTHHPLCKPFYGHTLKVFGKDVCRGCLFWYPGIFLGIISGLISNFVSLKIDLLVLFLFILVIPTLFQIPFTIPRTIKDGARFLLGLSTGLSLLVIIIHPDIFIKISAIVTFIALFFPLTIVRNGRNEKICIECPEISLRGESKCSGYKFMRERTVIANTQLVLGITDINEVKEKVKSFDEI